jgi:hypothetical protein
VPGALEQKTGSPAYVYNYAAYLGKSTRDPGACASHFRSCSDGDRALSSFMNEVFTPDVCDTSSVFSNVHENNNQY